MNKPKFDDNVSWYRCPECNSVEIHCFRSGVRISDKDGYVEFNCDGIYEGFKCQNCGWENL